MKTLVKLFIISIIIFSYSHANEKYFNDLYKSEIKKYEQYINYKEKRIKRIQDDLKDQHPKHHPIFTQKQKLYIARVIKTVQNEKRQKEEALESFKKLFVTNKRFIYNQLKENLLKKYDSEINRINHNLELLKRKHDLEKLKKKYKDPSAYLRQYATRKDPYENKKNALISAYDIYLKSQQVRKKPSKVLNTSKNNKLKVSTANMSKNTSKVTLKSSNLKTTVKTNNISVSNKAKASVGSVSIGKE